MGVFVSRAGAVRLIRVDRSDDNTCEGLPVCTTVAPDFGGEDGCGVYWADLADPHFTRRGVRLTSIAFGARALETARVCITPRGRMVEAVGGTWSDADAPLEVLLDRTGGGVVRRIIINNMGMPRVML
jgi:hypothetical protein